MNELTIYDRVSDPQAFLKEMGKTILHGKMFGVDNASQGEILALECAVRRMPPLALAERYHFIFGKLSMKADAMLADFRQKYGGRHVQNCRDSNEASITLILDGQEQTYSLTWEEARQEPFVYDGKAKDVLLKLLAGLPQSETLKIKEKYVTPRSRSQMLWARVVSDGVRAMAPEVVAGYYTPEEIEDFEGVDTIDEIVTSADAAQPTVVQKSATHVPPEPVKEKTPPAEEPTAKPIVLGGGDDQSVHDGDPCGDDVAKQIVSLAKRLEMPDDVALKFIRKHNAERMQDVPLRDANKLLEKLRQLASDADIPF